MANEAEPIGLIAGGGRLPVLEAEGIRAAGRRVMCVGLADQFDDDLPTYCDAFSEAGLVRLGKWIRLLRRWGVKQAVMVGYVRKAHMYEPMRLWRQVPDWRAAWLWYRVLRHDKRDQKILGVLADELGRNGIELIDTTRYIAEHMAGEGVLTRCQPTSGQWADLRFAWPILMRLNELDIGQSLAVKERDVIAVEAFEGTDEMIERAGKLCRSGGWVLAKGALPTKDLRFDVPTLGVQTIENVKRAGGRCIVVSAGKVILADKPAVIAAADAAKIPIVGMGADDAEAAAAGS
ncbi:LpxI family protein [Phycisphaerales bacterium AB-hyl4]|uniref:LpxI family protein n=1 Tax=Natronomicrosphaera hydrolytica TaxID=3242702 RepID=A0ABV4U132_9BACT